VTAVGTQTPARARRTARMVTLRSSMPLQLVTLRHQVPLRLADVSSEALLVGLEAAAADDDTARTTPKVERTERVLETVAGKGEAR
jgi:hypothetical protein